MDSLEYDVALSDNYIDKTKDTTPDKSDESRHILNEQIILFLIMMETIMDTSVSKD